MSSVGDVGLWEQGELARRTKEEFERPFEVEAYRSGAEHGPTRWESKALGMLPAPPARVLDLGCGAGRIAVPLAAQGYHLTCVDVSQPLVEQTMNRARERGLVMSYRTADSAELLTGDLRWERFDGVLSIKQLCYLPGRDRRRQQLNLIRRLLTASGVFIVASHVVPSLEEAERAIASDAQHRRFAGRYGNLEPLDTFSAHGGYVHWFTEAVLLTELRDAALDVEAITRSEDGLQIAVVLSRATDTLTP